MNMDPERYYDKFFDGFLTYEQFLGSNDIIIYAPAIFTG